MPRKRANDRSTAVPQQHIESFARCLLPHIQMYFESKAGQREFAEWKKKQSSMGKTKA